MKLLHAHEQVVQEVSLQIPSHVPSLYITIYIYYIYNTQVAAIALGP